MKRNIEGKQTKTRPTREAKTGTENPNTNYRRILQLSTNQQEQHPGKMRETLWSIIKYMPAPDSRAFVVNVKYKKNHLC